MKEIYLDYAAATPLDPRVLKEMDPFLHRKFGNPSSFHAPGLEAKDALDQARIRVASLLHCEPTEIIFTGSGTESINLALKGCARVRKKKGNHIITTAVEHEAVLKSLSYLEEKEGVHVTILPVDCYGRISLSAIEKAITKKTILISIIFANNEIGTLNPIEKIARIAKKRKIAFHTDACQAAASQSLDVKKLGVDLLSINAAKISGPKGVGLLYKRKDVQIDPVVHGGGQEWELRAGTENVAGIVGFAKALELAQEEKVKETPRLEKLRDKLSTTILTKIPNCKLNGDPKNRLPNNVNISFRDIDAEELLLLLNKEKIYASSGSACATHTSEKSHVLTAIGIPESYAKGTIRFSLGKETTDTDIDKVISVLEKSVNQLRQKRYTP
ncbi:cysteine desulfurase NifS [Candidatus Woesearchaeota archaeon]|nr:cysteine desulfurase NifS [Candidatus Woesearchaeota archaeon]